ncbi:hypothetical protein [Pediococcus pentosaceus]|jgi:hypothetical protein|uniref:hypothetical protein n=1 Tax=Pediococcus pentosaceus TaxID=1255 RepID=UPI00104B88E5|nr:hypothetical protein [Pediococcus pentosaceus]
MAEVDFKDNVTPFPTHTKQDHQNGGGSGMDKYVTHQEFNKSMQDINRRFDLLDAHLDTKFEKINTKFEQQKVWFYGTGISIIVAMIAVFNFFS